MAKIFLEPGKMLPERIQSQSQKDQLQTSKKNIKDCLHRAGELSAVINVVGEDDVEDDRHVELSTSEHRRLLTFLEQAVAVTQSHTFCN